MVLVYINDFQQYTDIGNSDALLSKELIKYYANRANVIVDLIRFNPAITISKISIIQKISICAIERDIDLKCDYYQIWKDTALLSEEELYMLKLFDEYECE